MVCSRAVLHRRHTSKRCRYVLRLDTGCYHIDDREGEESVGKARDAGLSLEATQAASSVPTLLHAPVGVPQNPELQTLIEQLLRLNVLATYRAFEDT